jgi:DNA modification methylase
MPGGHKESEMSTQANITEASSTRPWPAEQVERWAIERLIPYADNARLHSEADIDKLADSLRRFGWTNPVLVDENGVLICGHGRVRAAAKLGLTSIPVMVARGWSDEEKRAYRLADNQLTLRGSWDLQLLGKELREIGSADFDLSLIGFEPDRLERILAGLGSSSLADPDSVPAIPDQPVTRPGDVWLLGEHRIGCGDSTSGADVASVLAGSEPHLMVTEPPSGVGYDPRRRSHLSLSRGKPAQGEVLNDDRTDWRQAYALFPGDTAYVWCGALHGDIGITGLAACGFELRAQIIWVKQYVTSGPGDYRRKHEVCWYAVRDGKPSHWQGDRKQTTVWEIADVRPLGKRRREDSPEDPNRKPIECMRRAMINNSCPGEAIYDPFLGSGSSVIAAEMSGRICYGLELNPAYVDVAVRRWQIFTGRAARNQASGQSFDDHAARRDQALGGTSHGETSLCRE